MGRDRLRIWIAVAIAAVAAVMLLPGVLLRLAEPQGNEGTPLDVPDPDAVYDPVRAGEPPPEDFREIVARDRIKPIYAPRFVAASQSDWPDDALVLGVEINGDARAYPISVLNWREMVLDRVGGVPILATW